MRPLILLSALLLFCACSSGASGPLSPDSGVPVDPAVETPPSKLPAELKPPTAPGGSGLPADLKPPR
jgi:hypothetical protein